MIEKQIHRLRDLEIGMLCFLTGVFFKKQIWGSIIYVLMIFSDAFITCINVTFQKEYESHPLIGLAVIIIIYPITRWDFTIDSYGPGE